MRWNDPLWSYKVFYQTYGMVGLAKSVVQGYGWLKSLWSGPVTKKQDVPRPRLEMIPPPVSPAQVAKAQPQFQTV